MQYPNFWIFYVATVGILWLFLLVITAYRASSSRLRSRGMKEEYVQFLRKDITTRSLGIGIAIPILLLVAAGIVWLIAGDIHQPERLLSIVLLFLILVIPFPILDTMQLNKKYKELALETGSETVVDVSYKILHLVFNPTWELLAALLYVAFFVAFIEPFHVAFIHLLLLWFLYAAARSGKYLTQPMLKDGYVYVFVFLILNQGFLLYHLLNVSIHRLTCEHCSDPTVFVLGTVLGELLAIKIAYYLSRYPRFSQALSG
jgi:hypothetical protein